MARDVARIASLPHASLVRGDYADIGSLREAFKGIETALIVSGYAPPMERALLHKNAFEAAAGAGVRHVVYLSFQGAATTSRFPMGRDHHQSEQYLYATNMPFTALRDNLYLDIVPHLFDERGRMRGPAGLGAAAWVAREDVARAAAAALCNYSDTTRILDITGPEALTMAETAARLSEMCDRTLTYENESVEDGRAWRMKLGAPEWEVDTWLGSYEAIAAGELKEVSGEVEALTGRPPLKLEEYFAANSELLSALRP